ncbi:carotenoid 1,2-hydratase [Pseudoponticoccus marisrubri]|uniref:Hydroxyneurosporene dehydrogenase n=1 Tax=Pseudoponticoccus marisrubri TaxID=1685382 RepID=A0A0W7WHM1_9RHOB|nr:carotenoid 1,2-hydratase [Pseudoponticoccus marisrubri]KUF10069.1 hydroxyneurosporene dehydrogenase [Pseudoponticoccus marisrubri]
MSQDGRRAVSVIGFIGSVFSPWYRWSGRRDPENHVCLNVVTYGPGGKFCMTDRGRNALRQSAHSFTVGPSSMHWTGTQLDIHVDEVAAPPQIGRLRGRITLRPCALSGVELPLTPDGAHVWRPFAPVSRIEVDLGPGGQWQGHGYFDANFGTRALEADFDYWTWGRFPTPDGALCLYDATRRDGSTLAQAVQFDRTGAAEPAPLLPKARLRRSLWAVRRETRADAGHRPKQSLAMLDAPFYTRAAVTTRIDGHESLGVHEALDLRRFRSPLLMPMLAMRVPRRARWTHRD